MIYLFVNTFLKNIQYFISKIKNSLKQFCLIFIFLYEDKSQFDFIHLYKDKRNE